MSTEVTSEAITVREKSKRWPWALAILLALIAALSTQVSLFVIQPLGSIPEGRTLLVWRTDDMKFVDSADAICLRRTGAVSLMCRGMAMVRFVDPEDILLRMPYSEQLYLLSTDGKTFDR